LFVDPYLAYYFYAFRVDRAPFDDIKVRRAFNMAIDKERLVTDITRAMQVPADGPVPPFFTRTMGYPRSPGDTFDPSAARRLLAEAGYPNGVGLAPITLIYNTYESHRMIAEFVQRSIKENLGFPIAIENMEWKSLLKRLRTGDFQVSRFGWIGLPDPHTFLKMFRTNSTNNNSGYKNQEIDRLLDASLKAPSERERLATLARAEAIIQRDVPIAPLYYYTRPYLKAPVLRGLEPELNDTHLVKYMYWGDKERTP
ncbi:MAG: ABC transporter substrate-binding protein, partial [Myxococcota bacterium]|nr:ABC transporter substrate-binding protein [Myxococcota bacterium]